MSRSTVADCLTLLALPETKREVLVRYLNEIEDASRAETYTYLGCATKGCIGTVRVVRASNGNLCSSCHTQRSK